MQYQGQSPFPQDWSCLPDTAMSTPQSCQSVWFPLCFVPDSDSLGSLPRAECRAIRAGSWCPCVIAQIKLYSGFVMTTQSAIMSELFPLFPFRDINIFLFSNPPWMPYWNPQGEMTDFWDTGIPRFYCLSGQARHRYHIRSPSCFLRDNITLLSPGSW